VALRHGAVGSDSVGWSGAVARHYPTRISGKRTRPPRAQRVDARVVWTCGSVRVWVALRHGAFGSDSVVVWCRKATLPNVRGEETRRTTRAQERVVRSQERARPQARDRQTHTKKQSTCRYRLIDGLHARGQARERAPEGGGQESRTLDCSDSHSNSLSYETQRERPRDCARAVCMCCW